MCRLLVLFAAMLWLANAAAHASIPVSATSVLVAEEAALPTTKGESAGGYRYPTNTYQSGSAP